MGIFKMKLVKSDNGGSDFGLIGRGIEVTGDIVFSDRLHVDGKVSGKLSSESGTLVIGEAGQVEAQLDVGICVIHGAFHGNLIARSKVEIHKTGRVHGDYSAFNILWHQQAAVVIDFPQVIELDRNPDAHVFLERDIRSLCRSFAKQGVKVDEAKLSREIRAVQRQK